ncbi:MAG: RNA methyltransferase [Lachnospiraceae bacterium]|nr:RNA methyltransferase [Lachnospiraceae bacterium]
MITSTSNARIRQVVQWQTKGKERRKDHVFVAEGAKMFAEAPADWIREVYVSSGFLEKLKRTESQSGLQQEQVQEQMLREKLAANLLEKFSCVPYEEVSEEVFSKISDTQTPQGVLAVLEQPRYTLQEILQPAAQGSVEKKEPLLVLLENLQDPGNLGTIIRTGEGAGITGVIMSASTVDIFNPKVIRSTMGSIYRMPFVYVEDLCDTVRTLHTAGIKSYAAHLQGTAYYDSFSFTEPTAFLIGNEGNGLTPALSETASFYIKIPMEGQVESLNAGVACALLMYEAHRQRA